MNKIYVFGDSHVGVFMGTDELIREKTEYTDSPLTINGHQFSACRIGPRTAHNLLKNEVIKDFLKITPSNTTVMLSFGEIDCRKHLSEKLNIRETVDNYFKFIDVIKLTNNVVLYLPPASSATDKDCEGTEEERNKITEEFTNKCKEEADKRGILCISILNDLMTDYKTDMSYYVIRKGDSIHLNQKVIPLLLKEFEKHEI